MLRPSNNWLYVYEYPSFPTEIRVFYVLDPEGKIKLICWRYLSKESSKSIDIVQGNRSNFSQIPSQPKFP